MFDSGITVKELVDELIAEVDVALDIPKATYVTWLNSLQQMLYTEVIKEQTSVDISIASKLDGKLPTGDGSNGIRFEDIVTLYADDVQLIKSTYASGNIFPNTFYKDGNDSNVYFNAKFTTENETLRIVYLVKPKLIKVNGNDEIDDSNVMLPIEFIELAKAKLRGEAYKLANEFDYAANWLNDYNNLLETFKLWIAEKSPNFGL
jgi:hypothetical protein